MCYRNPGGKLAVWLCCANTASPLHTLLRNCSTHYSNLFGKFPDCEDFLLTFTVIAILI